MELFAIQNLTFTYPEQDAPVLRDISLTLKQSDFAVLAGSSGCGKSTLLRQMKTVLAPHGVQEGRILYNGTPLHEVDARTQAAKIGFALQDPDSQIVTDKVWHELAFGMESLGVDNTTIRGRVAEMASFFGIQTWFHMEVSQLSGGEQQRTALAKVLLQDPDVLLLDEPTKGVDNDFKLVFAQILKELTARDICIIMVSHDVEFCARYADRCGLFFDGSIVTMDAPQPFFAGKSFYTTAANRMARHLLSNAVTPEDVITACGGCVEEKEMPPRVSVDLEPPEERKPEKLPKWRKILGFLTGAMFFGTLLYTSLALDLSALYQGGNFLIRYGWLYGLMFGSFGVFAACISRKYSARDQRLMKGKLTARTKATILLSLLLIPLTIWGGIQLNGGRKYMLISLAIIFETMLPFFLIFEGRKLQARERFSLSVFGGLVTFLIYGGIMNPASVLMYQANPDWQMILTAYITGVPADAIHALATAMFLWFLSEPMLEKLDRVKIWTIRKSLYLPSVPMHRL